MATTTEVVADANDHLWSYLDVFAQDPLSNPLLLGEVSLYQVTAAMLAPAMDALIDNTHGRPDHFDSVDEWIAVLIQIRDTFQHITDWANNLNDLDDELVRDGLALFATHFMSLWH